MHPTYHGTYILYILPLRKEKWDILSKYWTKARWKPNRANIKAWSSTSRIWGFFFKGFGWLPPCRFTAYFIHLSVGLVTLPVCSSPLQISHDSGVSNTGNLQGNIGFMQCLIRASVQGLHLRCDCQTSLITSLYPYKTHKSFDLILFVSSKLLPSGW